MDKMKILVVDDESRIYNLKISRYTSRKQEVFLCWTKRFLW